MTRVFISIGSNLGPRKANCLEAVRRLSEADSITLVRRSPLYETSPWGRAGQGPFVNCAVEAATTLSPHKLLETLKKIESDMGRRPSGRWGPRPIDLDIIFYGGKIIETPGLTVPHPHAHERGFVLAPLADIAPDFRHPAIGRSVKELLSGLEKRGAVGIVNLLA